ncbi:U32 family peptidase C-terminal domain-containing protein [Desulfobacterales bacterium HSG2]|nr:U32 family peptidase C-terminal domain-containing protein [Desulfobacterales bacterium HSG2]
MHQAVRFAHEHGVKVYVACNIYPRNDELEAIADYMGKLGEIAPDAVIVADPGIFMLAREVIPQIPLHVSTQANITHYRSALFWENIGAKRVNVARELSLKEIKEIAEQSSAEIEAFVHGAMCISYSGRCLLSSFMAKRDSNRGMCCHPCRFRYTLMEALRPGQYYPIMEDDRGAYIFNSRDLCMIEHIPEMIESGIRSLKIEGRMKGINYVAATVKVYREAIDAYYAHSEAHTVRKEWLEELAKINYREYCTGFYLGDPDQLTLNYNKSKYAPGPYRIVGKVIGKTGPKSVSVDVRNKFLKGDAIEILTKKGPVQTDKILDIVDEDGESVSFAQTNTTVVVTLESECCSVNDLMRIGVKG